MLSYVWLFATPGNAARQAPLSMGFSRQEYWSGLPCPPAEDLPDPRVEHRPQHLLHLQKDPLPLHTREPHTLDISLHYLHMILLLYKLQLKALWQITNLELVLRVPEVLLYLSDCSPFLKLISWKLPSTCTCQPVSSSFIRPAAKAAVALVCLPPPPQPLSFATAITACAHPLPSTSGPSPLAFKQRGREERTPARWRVLHSGSWNLTELITAARTQGQYQMTNETVGTDQVRVHLLLNDN